MKIWAIQIKGPLTQFCESLYMFYIYFFINPLFQCFMPQSIFSSCFIFQSDCTTPWLVLLWLVSFLFADRFSTSSISSLHSHVYVTTLYWLHAVEAWNFNYLANRNSSVTVRTLRREMWVSVSTSIYPVSGLWSHSWPLLQLHSVHLSEHAWWV